MSDPVGSPSDAEWRKHRAAAIRAFAGEFLAGPNQELFEEMLVTLCRLSRDAADRGDVKLIGKALGELRYAFKVFRPYGAHRKISIFGSSRTPETHPDYQAAVEFARRMRDHAWMVITGAGDGIMMAGHGGAGADASFGVAIRLPFEQKTNAIIKDDAKLVNFRYFFTRKLMFLKEASAVALFPGGFGTLDEGFEVLTLAQTGKTPLIPIVMVEQPGGTYWHAWLDYVRSELLAKGMVSEQDMNLFRITDDIETAVRDVVDFYRVYHSMRYVGEVLVLRLKWPLSAATLDRLNEEFGVMLTGGSIEQCAPLPEEGGVWPELSRLKMRFDRRSFGLLRACLDRINQEPLPAAGSPPAGSTPHGKGNA